jgi:peptide chain release factor subunit 1
MITHETLHHLEQFHSPEGILSLYLRIDPQHMDHPGHPLVEFKGLLRRYLERPSAEDGLAAVQREKQRVMDYLQGWVTRGRGLAIFACEPLGLWEVLNLDNPVPSSLEVDPSPRTGLLRQVMDESPSFVVVVVHRDQASIYTTEQRASDKRTEITSAVQGWHKQGGWSQSRFQRHIQYQVNEHMKKVIEDLESLLATRAFGRLAIGGTDATVKELIHQLPDPLARRLIGTFLIDCKHDSEDDVLNKARKVNEDFERAMEKQLIDRIVNAAHSGGQGVVGIDATLPKIIEGRVQTLVLADGATQTGQACSQCEFFSTAHYERCPLCDGEVRAARDIIDRATDRAVLSGAHIETVFGEARDWLLAQGGMGAVLRY